MRKGFLIILMLIPVLLSLLKWKLLLASLASFLMMLVLLAAGKPAAWNGEIIEYWVAGVAWCCSVWFVLWQLFRRRPARTMALPEVFLIIVATVALLTPLLAPLPPNVQADVATSRLLPPLSSMTVKEKQREFRFEHAALDAATFAELEAQLLQREFVSVESGGGVFVFGSDDVGRDVFSRVLAGSRVSLFIGIAAALCAAVLGTIVGFLAGYGGSMIDSLLMRGTDLFLAIPSLFLAVGMIALLGYSPATLVLVLAVTGWMSIARTVRIEVKNLREKEFILAARLLNQSPVRIFRRHILPNIRHVVAAAFILQFGSAVLAEASLSFLGLGIQPPTASWGNMLGQSLGYLRHGWWLALFPGAALAGVLVAVQTILERSDTRA